jgi:hypothetical protein
MAKSEKPMDVEKTQRKARMNIRKTHRKIATKLAKAQNKSLMISNAVKKPPAPQPKALAALKALMKIKEVDDEDE